MTVEFFWWTLRSNAKETSFCIVSVQVGMPVCIDLTWPWSCLYSFFSNLASIQDVWIWSCSSRDHVWVLLADSSNTGYENRWCVARPKDYAFFGVYIAELVLRFIAFGPRAAAAVKNGHRQRVTVWPLPGVIKSNWVKFDMFLVASATADILLKARLGYALKWGTRICWSTGLEIMSRSGSRTAVDAEFLKQVMPHGEECSVGIVFCSIIFKVCQIHICHNCLYIYITYV